jgi:hypothetical protein
MGILKHFLAILGGFTIPRTGLYPMMLTYFSNVVERSLPREFMLNLGQNGSNHLGHLSFNFSLYSWKHNDIPFLKKGRSIKPKIRSLTVSFTQTVYVGRNA